MRDVRVFCSTRWVQQEADVCYRTGGNEAFHAVTGKAGLASRDGRALTAIAVHLNEDPFIDLYVTNDLHANSLFLNEGNGRFRDESEMSGAAYDGVGNVMSSMGVDAADTNGNGRFDLIVTHFQREYNVLYQNADDGLFYDVSQADGLAAPSMPYVGWGVVLADFDLDGDLDLLIGSEAEGLWLYRNTGTPEAPAFARDEAFEIKSHPFATPTLVDIDDDGDLDLFVGGIGGGLTMFRNGAR